MTGAHATDVYGIRTDGGSVLIRPIDPSDRAELEVLHHGLSDRSRYQRFFSTAHAPIDAYVDRLLRAENDDHAALVAITDGRIVGVAGLERVDPDRAELSLVVADDAQHEGIGTLLLERLTVLALAAGVRLFVAEVLAANGPMIDVVRHLGYPLTMRSEREVDTFEWDITPRASVIAASDAREQIADEQSLRYVLAPRCVAVVGASPTSHTVGHELVNSILAGGYTGRLYAVNPRHVEVLGVPCFSSVADLPEPPDLTLIAVPAAAVAEVVGACGQRGGHGVLVVTSGFAETGSAGARSERAIRELARDGGLRMIGPNCLGMINNAPAVRLRATFAPLAPPAGGLALVSQSGALGIAMLGDLERMGVGIAQFVSIGNKADVSSNDLLLAWEHDDRVTAIAMYLESFGNPRKFARIARRVTRRKPIIAIKAGRTAAGARAGQSHTGAAASSDVVVEALFAQAGVLRVRSTEQMLDAARVLADGTLPRGRRVAIIGNSGGPEILAADAVTTAGLEIVTLSDTTLALLGDTVPASASLANPIDLGAAAQPTATREALRILLDSGEVDAVLTVFAETLVADLAALSDAVAGAAAATDRPVIACVLAGPGTPTTTTIGSGARAVAVFDEPERAVSALAIATRYMELRERPEPIPVRPADVDTDRAVEIIKHLSGREERWLGAGDVEKLLDTYGIRVCEQHVVSSGETAAAAAKAVGYPVAVKLASGLAHKTETDGVRIGLADEAGLLAAVADMRSSHPDADLLVQPMLTGVEAIVGAVQDDQFGPVVLVGAGGVFEALLDDHRVALAPVDHDQASRMIEGLKLHRLLAGYRGRHPASVAALTDVVVRVGWLIQDLPEIVELDLNPVICTAAGATTVDAKIRILARGGPER